jgi:hypothetical protein
MMEKKTKKKKVIFIFAESASLTPLECLIKFYCFSIYNFQWQLNDNIHHHLSELFSFNKMLLFQNSVLTFPLLSCSLLTGNDQCIAFVGKCLNLCLLTADCTLNRNNYITNKETAWGVQYNYFPLYKIIVVIFVDFFWRVLLVILLTISSWGITPL